MMLMLLGVYLAMKGRVAWYAAGAAGSSRHDFDGAAALIFTVDRYGFYAAIAAGLRLGVRQPHPRAADTGRRVHRAPASGPEIMRRSLRGAGHLGGSRWRADRAAASPTAPACNAADREFFSVCVEFVLARDGGKPAHAVGALRICLQTFSGVSYDS